MKQVAAALRPLLRMFLSIFFERRYLVGRYFDISLGGFVWAFRSIWSRNILRLAPPMPWPTCLTCHISNPKNIKFHPDDLNNFQSPGTYFQNMGAAISIGRGSYIGPNVGIITTNHRVDNLDEHDEGQPVEIGDQCWIGMNAVVLPGVILGQRTIVAAGAIVTKSFPNGNITIGGVPARAIGDSALPKRKVKP